jgi:2,3-dihydro-2,3-dihydroxybenzoate dehydrogenase
MHVSSLLKGKTAIVTGAGRGIGAAIATAFAQEGATVAVLDIDGDSARSTAERIGGYGFSADLTDPAAVERAVEDAVSALGGLDAFVNNAGVCSTGSLLTDGVEVWDRQFAVNARAAYLCCTAAARRMVAADAGGSIVVVTSNCAHAPRMDLGAYCASKAASEMMAECLALELAGRQIRVNTVNPGSCETEMQRRQWAELGVGPERQINGDPSTFRTGIPLGRLAQPEDIADVAVMLASDRTRFVTGQNWTVDGGQTL